MNAHQRKKYAKALMNEMRAATDDEKLQALVDAGRDLAKAASQIDRQHHRIDELEEEVRRIKAHRDEALSALEGMVGVARLTIGWSVTPANADGPLAVAEQLIARVKGEKS